MRLIRGEFELLDYTRYETTCTAQDLNVQAHNVDLYQNQSMASHQLPGFHPTYHVTYSMCYRVVGS